jgi:hypothetical protein
MAEWIGNVSEACLQQGISRSPFASIDEKSSRVEQRLGSQEILLNSLILFRVNLQDSEKHTLLHFVRWALANIQAPDIQGTPFP